MERSVKELAKYRFECCIEALEDARVMYDAKRYKNTLNRSYYSIFYAMPQKRKPQRGFQERNSLKNGLKHI